MVFPSQRFKERTFMDLNFNSKNEDTVYTGRLFSDIIDFQKDVKVRVTNDEHINIEPAVHVIDHIVITPNLIEKIYMSKDLLCGEEDYLIYHPVHALLFVLKIGEALKFSRKELFELGLSALLYDAGMYKVPESIIQKDDRLTESEVRTMRQHTEIGRNILETLEEKYSFLPRVAYEHHERESGQGYPRGIKGNEIHRYAKVLGLADTYEAMTHDRPYRKALLKHSSVKELVGSKNLLFPANLIKVSLEEIGLYPIGSYVRINNGAVGQVIATSKTYPLKPTIKLIFNSQGNAVSEETIINLGDHPVLYVSEAIHKGELSRG